MSPRAGLTDARGKLQLKVVANKKTVLDKELVLEDFYGSGKRISVPFLVYGTAASHWR